MEGRGASLHTALEGLIPAVSAQLSEAGWANELDGRVLTDFLESLSQVTHILRKEQPLRSKLRPHIQRGFADHELGEGEGRCIRGSIREEKELWRKMTDLLAFITCPW